MSESTSSSSDKDKVFFITNDEFRTEIQTEYAREIGDKDPESLYDHYNPGPTLPNGGVNFECHCVSHLVASPCGHEFREAITCQKTTKEEDLENGACADEFMKFMECVIRTDCFRSKYF
uniref:CHCH domain-containing protein n=1 Tax=Syphacia muris TaxID=451379 RepID=A0A0N5AMR3_9BILA